MGEFTRPRRQVPKGKHRFVVDGAGVFARAQKEEECYTDDVGQGLLSKGRGDTVGISEVEQDDN